jgi:hypothetical protein
MEMRYVVFPSTSSKTVNTDYSICNQSEVAAILSHTTPHTGRKRGVGGNKVTMWACKFAANQLKY